MADGFAELEAQIARLQRVAELPRLAAPDVAEALQEELEAQIARGQGPDGEAWAPRQEDGGQPLRGAAQALGVAAVGTTVIARLKGPEARHHLGRAKGGIVRRILPVQGIPDPMTRAIKRVVTEKFEEVMEVR